MRKDELLLRCDCSSGHFVAATVWPEDGEGFLELSGCWCDNRWKARIAQAWRAIRGQRLHEASVLLDKGAAMELQEFLNWHMQRLHKR